MAIRDLASPNDPGVARSIEPDAGRAAARVSVIVPAFNEQEDIDPLLEELMRAFRDERCSFEILIADGGSVDGTRGKVQAWSKDHPIRLVACSGAHGVAGDVVEAAHEARGEVVVVLDADRSHPPLRAPELARLILEDAADMAIGSRYCPGGSTRGGPFVRRAISRVAGLVVRGLQDARDPLSGFFAVRRDRLIEAGSAASGSRLGLELLILGGESLRVVEIPIEFRGRKPGESKPGSGEGLSFFRPVFDLLGGLGTTRAAIRFAVIGLLGMLVDMSCFRALLASGSDLATAHLGGFLAASAFTYLGHALWTFRSGSERPAPLGWRGHARLLIVALMALSLRGAVLALVVHAGGRPETALILPLLVGAVVNYVGSIFYVFRSAREHSPGGDHWRGAALVLCSYLMLLRLCCLGLPSLLPEEAYYWNYAQHPSLSYLDHPPMVALMISAGTGLFGDTEFGVRFPAFLCSLLWMYFGYRLACNLHDRSAGIRSALLLTALPLFVAYGFFMTPDSPLLASWAGTLFFLERAVRGQKRNAWYAAGACLGLGLLSKYTILLLVPATLVYLVVDRSSRPWFRRREPYLALALALLIFSPVLVWNANHGWASFIFQGARRASSDFGFGFPRLALSVLLVLSPTVAVAAVAATWRRPAQSPEPRSASRAFALVFLLVPLSVFVLFSLVHTDIKLNWTGPAWLAVLPLVASQAMRDGRADLSRGRRLLASAWGPTLCGLVVFYGLAFQYLTLGAPGLAYPQSRLFGWEDLARQVEDIEDQVERESGVEPLVVGLDKYDIASELAFYRSKARSDAAGDEGREGVGETTGRQLFGQGSLMYGYWPLTGTTQGRTVIVVADDEHDLLDHSVQQAFARLSPPRTIRALHNGKESSEFHYAVGYDYRGLVP